MNQYVKMVLEMSSKRIIMPFVQTVGNPACRTNIKDIANKMGIRYEIYELAKDKDDDYWELFRDIIWDDWYDTVLVEHDVIPTYNQIYSLFQCDEKFCITPTWIQNNWYPGFGCVKFGTGLVQEQPSLIKDIDIKNWRTLDTIINRRLKALGYEYHQHLPPAQHLHDYPNKEPKVFDPELVHGLTPGNEDVIKVDYSRMESNRPRRIKEIIYEY